jgi:hypothetical protein
MKKFIAGLLMGFLLTFSVAAYAAGDIRLVINGKDITDTMDVKPQLVDGRTMVPAKYVAEALGAAVTWDSATNSVVITSGQAETTTPAETDKPEPTTGPWGTTIQTGEKIYATAGKEVTLLYQGEPNTEYKIDVYYASGPSKSPGLIDGTTGLDGKISWTWKVGTNTTLGEYRIVITGNNKSIEKTLVVQ